MNRALQVLSAVATFALASCATVKQVGKGSLAFVQKTSSATSSQVSKFSEIAVNTIHPPAVKIVEVREKDLKELPSGHEKALAFENTRKRGFWFFNGPVDFTEPNLPQPGGETDGSLLPPKTP